MSIVQKLAKQFVLDVKERHWNDILRGGFLWTNVIVSSVFFASSIVAAFPFVYPFDRQRHSLHALASDWAKTIQYLNPWWKFNITGKENLAIKGKAVIYVANHQSQADILALFIISTRFRWLSKDSLFKIPIFGWGMSAVGYVPVKRGNKKSAEQCMRLAARHIKNGTPMLFFPEGTRSKTGKIGEFKSGAFRLAKAMNVPIIPITVNGCSDLLPKGSLLPKRAEVTITIHPPIETTNLEVSSIIEKAQEIISSVLPEPLK